MPKRTVLFDRIAWYDEDGERQFADEGTEVDLPESEAERLDGLGATGTQEDYVPRETVMAQHREAVNEARRTQTEETPEGVTRPGASASDDALRDMNVDETVAHLQQHPQDADRIDALEAERSTRRKGVDEALETIRANRSE